MATQNICNFNKFGFCKFRDRCRKQHVNDKCENSSCDISVCILRHPRRCKFYSEYKRCKYGEWCRFEHVENLNNVEIDDLKKENESILTKLAGIENTLKEKDNLIESLLQKFKDMELKLNNISEEKTVSEKIKCAQCEFETISERGLKVHMKRKHAGINTGNYPRQCELCDKEFENAKEMKTHMKRHSYKYAQYQCEDCEYVGQNEETMDVHNGRAHCENFECGLCEFEAGS